MFLCYLMATGFFFEVYEDFTCHHISGVELLTVESLTHNFTDAKYLGLFTSQLKLKSLFRSEVKCLQELQQSLVSAK